MRNTKKINNKTFSYFSFRSNIKNNILKSSNLASRSSAHKLAKAGGENLNYYIINTCPINYNFISIPSFQSL